MLDGLRPYCRKAEIAGSVRRGERTCHDIDLVIVPENGDLFGDQEIWTISLVEYVRSNPAWTLDREFHQQTRYVKLRSVRHMSFTLDLSLCGPDRFGWILALRTGPQEFTKALVSIVKRAGWTFTEGRLWRVEWADSQHYLHEARLIEPIETPEEKDLFDALGLPYIEPPDRTAERLIHEWRRAQMPRTRLQLA